MNKTKFMLFSIVIAVFSSMSFSHALQVDLIFPQDNTMYNHNIKLINVSVISNSTISSVIANIDNSLNVTLVLVNGSYINDTIDIGYGKHTVTVVATDVNNETNTSIANFIVDTKMPVVYDRSPKNNSYVKPFGLSGRLCIDAEYKVFDDFSDKIYCENHFDKVDGSQHPYSTLNANNDSLVRIVTCWEPSQIEGEWTWYTKCTDKAGNTIIVPEYHMFVDYQPPKTYDNNNESIIHTKPFNITLNCTDNFVGCNYTVYFVDGENHVSYSNPTNVTISGDGNHTIEYYSVDKSNNVEGKHTIYAALDMLPPNILVISPTNDSWISTNTVDFTFKSIDNISKEMRCSLTTYKIKCYFTDDSRVYTSGPGPSYNSLVMYNDTEKTFSIHFDCISGDFYWNVTCNDTVDHTAYSSYNMFHIDTVPPLVELLSPENMTYTNDNSIDFECGVQDNIAVDNVSLLIKTNDGWFIVSTNSSGYNNEKYVFKVDVSELGEGTYEWNCKACDYASCSFGNSRTFVIDRTNPEIVDVNPLNNSVVNVAEEISSGKKWYGARVEIKPMDLLSPTMNCTFYMKKIEDRYWYQHTNSSIENNSYSMYGVLYTDRNRALGNWTWYVTCTDKAGNEGNVSNLMFYVDGTPPYTNTTTKDGWYNKPMNITLRCFDDSKCNKTYYWINNEKSVSYDNPTNITIEKEGNYTIKYNSVDIVGNEEENHTLNILLDMTPPTIDVLTENGKRILKDNAKIEFTPYDNMAKEIKCSVADEDGNGKSYNVSNGTVITYSLSYLSTGKHTIHITCEDKANNTKSTDIEVYLYRPRVTTSMPFGPENVLNLDKNNTISFTMSEGYSAKFQAYSEVHTIMIINIDANTVTFEIQSEPITVEIDKGETKYIDLDGDGIDDISVTVIEIYSLSKAGIRINLLEHPTIPENIPVNNTQTEVNNIQNNATKENYTQPVVEENKTQESVEPQVPTGRFVLTDHIKYITSVIIVFLIFVLAIVKIRG